MAFEDCVLPELLEHLRPYVKPRDEVLHIRENLQKHVHSQVQSNGAKDVSFVSLLSSQYAGNTPTTSSLTGVRKAYLKALEAHVTAQGRYDALKADLDRLSDAPNDNASQAKPSSISDSYVPLLRQRERQRKLQVLDRTISQITATGKSTVDGHLDDIVRVHAGDVPQPPVTRTPSFGEKQDVGSRILELKKAVLSTKRTIDDSDTASSANSHAEISSEAQIAGLQAALNELTGWMETQLAVIGEGEAENQQAPPTPGQQTNGSHSEVASPDAIEALYEDCVAARQSLIQTVSNPSSSPAFEPDLAAGSSPSPGSTHRPTAAEVLLLYLTRLQSAKQKEETLRQQTTHLRRQIGRSEADAQRLVSRLADESHMVQPGASKGQDWSRAAGEAGQATTEYAKARLDAAEDAVGRGVERIEEVGSVPELLDVLETK